MMHGHGKSDSSIVPAKPPNEAGPEAKEAVEGRGLAKGKTPERNMSRTQGRSGMSSALERIRQAARRDKRQRFTALLHHVYDVEGLRAAYFGLKREAAAGIDGKTWRQYGEELERNLLDLSDRLRRGAYQAQPVRRAYIAKAGEPQKRRPLGILVLEDKIVQRAVAEVLSALYEQDFVGFSYGFRPGRSPHQALDALVMAILRRKVNWVLDADIRAFFDTLEHGWLVEVYRASCSGSARGVAYSKVAQGRSAGGWQAYAERAGNGTRRKYQCAVGQHLPALCVGPVGSPMAEKASTRGSGGGEVCR